VDKLLEEGFIRNREPTQEFILCFYVKVIKALLGNFRIAKDSSLRVLGFLVEFNGKVEIFALDNS